ncbi:MAG: DUF3109 family protein [Bacteroidales bacterium]
MIRIDDTVISLDLLTERFRCDLSVCKGNCCRYGDAGAPLTESEAAILKEIYPDIKGYLRKEGIESIEHYGTSLTDVEGELVTPLIGDAECAYTILSDDIFLCAIEKAWHDGVVSFRKPLSCHLFPVRTKDFTDFTAVNYDKWSICQGGREAGRIENILVYNFLKEPLIRAFGSDWYDELATVRRELESTGLIGS